jgi:hypothetical protein
MEKKWMRAWEIARRRELRGAGDCVAQGIAQHRELRGAEIRHKQPNWAEEIPMASEKTMISVKSGRLFPQL